MTTTPRSKYGNRKTVSADGQVFDSKREAQRWEELRLMLASGLISELRRQVRYPITVLGYKVCTYVADFVYAENGQTITEDCKGYRTDVYKLKRKLMRACYGIEVRET